MNRRHFLIATALVMGACASTDREAGMVTLEPVYAVEMRPDGLRLEVGSNGCTRKEDFAFFVERRGRGTSVAFARRTLDNCKSFAMGKTEIAFSWKELGLPGRDNVRVINPMTPWPGR